MNRTKFTALACTLIIMSCATFVLIQPSGQAGDGVKDPASIKITHTSVVKTILGDAKIKLTVMNEGDLAGSKTYTFLVYLGSDTYSQPVTVELNGGETKTYTVDLDLPIDAVLYDWTWDVSPSQ